MFFTNIVDRVNVPTIPQGIGRFIVPGEGGIPICIVYAEDGQSTRIPLDGCDNIWGVRVPGYILSPCDGDFSTIYWTCDHDEFLRLSGAVTAADVAASFVREMLGSI